ncbi:MAG: polysaccharide deacetylase family protein [Clostridia bacterium]|nr:polysaccharide deacetylase family protein [Clostridia bacterium]
MTTKRPIIYLLLISFVLSVLAPISIGAAKAPEISVYEHTVSITNADEISYIRYAKGDYNDSSSIKNAADCVSLNERLVANASANGVYSVTLTESGIYSFWVKMSDGSTYILKADLKPLDVYADSDGVTITVHNLEGVRNFLIAKGTYDNYADTRTNQIVGVSSEKIKGANEYSYTVREDGEYTVAVRYFDTAKENKILHLTLTVIKPDFIENGLQVKIGNLDSVKVIRTAYGEYNTMGDIKRAEGSRSFNAKTIGTRSPYTVQYRENGRVTVGVAYNNGYYEVYHYDVEKRVPTVVQEEETVTFGNLTGLQNIRYAKGEYYNAASIKNAEGSVTLKRSDVVNGEVSVTLEPGTYSFCVQYDDESYNYYIITVKGEEEIIIPTATAIGVSGAFSDNMILQRDEKLSVWGVAGSAEGTTVLCEISGEKALATVDANGNWKAEFDKTFSYTTEGTTLRISCADGCIEFKNILFGDVYYIMGQSNAYYSLGELQLDLKLKGLSDQLQIDYDDNRDIRFYRISNQDYKYRTGALAQGTALCYEGVYNGAKWLKPSDIQNQMLTYANFTPAGQLYDRDAVSSKVFSAIGYTFAYNMSNRSDVPVGVIEIDASGHPLITFAPNDLAEKWGQEELDPITGTYHYRFDHVWSSELKTRYAYNQQIYPLRHFSIAGIIWYQGESDWYNTREQHTVYVDSFAEQFAELMTYFRNDFGNNDFPVYMFEYATCYSNNGANAYMDFSSVKTELGTIPQILDNCYIMSSSDFWFDTQWINNVHPYIKHFQSYRLTDIVMADKFGQGNMDDVHGPVLNRVEYNGNRAVLYFDHVGEGLKTSDGGMLKGLEAKIIDPTGNEIWLPHEGYIITGKDQITVDTGNFQLLAIRYNGHPDYTFPYNLNLCNAYGMPAIAFVDYNYSYYDAITPKKYFTLSMDDGITQDAKLMEILEKYGVYGCSFNINTSLLGVKWDWVADMVACPGLLHQRFTEDEIRGGVYDGFEVLGHTRNHIAPIEYDEDPETLITEVEGCFDDIEDLTGTRPVGMAWPAGDAYRTETTIDIIANNTSCKFARGGISTYSYNFPTYFMEWMPTCHIIEPSMQSLAKTFADSTFEGDTLFFVWGHGYEFDQYDYYDEFEELIKTMVQADDVTFVTNTEFYELFKDAIPSWKQGELE